MQSFLITLITMVFTVLFSTSDARPVHAIHHDMRFAKRQSTPSGYSLVYSSLFNVLPATDLISQSPFMASFDPSGCAATCDANENCKFFNIFTTNSPDVGVYCTFYSNKHTAAEATNAQAPGGFSGQGVHNSYGYAKKSVVLAPTSSVTYSSMTSKGLTIAAVSQTPLPTIIIPKKALVVTSSSSSPSPSSSSCSIPSTLYSEWCGSEFEGYVETALEKKLSNIKTKNFIVPLYLYPAFWTTPGTWDWVISAIKKNPSVTFTIIINPSDGPGTGNTGAAPADYATGISALRAAGKNLQILGYVDTNLGARAKNDVLGDIKVYNSWTGSKLDGIFFDRQAINTAKYSVYNSYAKAVRASTGFVSKIPVVGSNPGTTCDLKYINLFDFVVVYDDTAANLENTIFGDYEEFLATVPEAQLNKLAWFVSEATSSTAKSSVTNLQAGLEAGMFYISDKTSDLAPVEDVDSSVLTVALKQIGKPTI